MTNLLLYNKLSTTEVFISSGFTFLRSVGSLVNKLKTNSFKSFRFLGFLKQCVYFIQVISVYLTIRNLKTILTFEFYIQKLNCLTVFFVKLLTLLTYKRTLLYNRLN